MRDFLRVLRAEQEALLAIGDLRRAPEYVARIKQVTRQQIQDIDPEAVVEDTYYFNHSAHPDFVVTWAKGRDKRNVFIRSSYADIVAADEVRSHAKNSPIFIALDARETFEGEFPYVGPEDIRQEASRSDTALVSDVEAVQALTDVPAEAASPVAELVRQNFMVGARGWVSRRRANDLVNVAGDETATSIGSLVRENFVDAAVARMARTATIVDLVSGRVSPDDEQVLETLSGRLSKAEVRVLIPWLLERAADVASGTWSKVGGLFDLEDLEQAYELLEGRDLSPLVAANAGRWSAKRAYLGLAIAEDVEGLALDRGGWRFHGKLLGLQVGEQRLSFAASDGRRLPSREGSRSPAWEEVATLIEPYKLTSVSLRGITRSVKVDAEESDDIRQDVVDVSSSLSDSYSVSSLVLRLPAASPDDPPVDVDVAFPASVVTASSPAALDELTRVGLTVLSYRSPVSADVLATYVPADG